MKDFQFTVGYCYPIANHEDWRLRHTFKFWHTAELKSVTCNEHNRYAVTLVSNEEPLESYKRDDDCYGNRHPSPEFLALYCTRNGNEFTFPDVQCVDFECKI